MSKIIYISGAMEGKKDLNFPAFHAAARHYARLGYVVLNPAEFGEHEGWTWTDYINRDLKVIEKHKPHAIALIDGWYESAGSQMEVIAAKKHNKFLEIIYHDEVKK